MSTPLELDPENFRSRIYELIARYNDAIEDLLANKPQIDPAAFGEGFVDKGEAIAAAVSAVHEQTIARLRSRVAQYESMLALTGDVSSTDGTNAGGFISHE